MGYKTIRREPGATSGALADRELSKLFVFNEVQSRRDLLSGDCSRICSCESLAFQQPSTPTKFADAKSKGVP
jgi:hypothetical protein